MTREEAQKVCMILAAAFRGDLRGMTTDEVKVWAETYSFGILDLDAAEVSAAVHRLVRSSKFMPRVAEIREAVIVTTRGQQRTGAEAWGDVLREVSRTGRYREPKFFDPLVSQVIAGMGWVQICDSENTVADRARFVDAYNEMARQGRQQAVVSDGAAAKALPSRGERSPALALVDGIAKKLGGGE